MSMPSMTVWTAVALSASVVAVGCGAATPNGNPPATATVARDPSSTCAATALGALGRVATRVYREGVAGERPAVAVHFITSSEPLRTAVEHDDPQAAQAAAQGLIATEHMTDLEVTRGSQVLADAGSPDALTPFTGTLTGAGGAPIGTFASSVWADSGFLAETDSITEGAVALRAGGRSLAGSFELPPGVLPTRGRLTEGGVSYEYTSFPAERYPSGTLRVYVLRSIPSIVPLCGASAEDTVAKALDRVARLIYDGEGGGRALTQVHRVQHDQALLRAVALRDPAATRQAIVNLLNEHIVRLRVSAGGQLLSDVGGPFVLAPVHAPLRLGGRTIGSFVLSIQDDEGYRRLTQRLAGLDVLMYMGPTLVKNDLGPMPGAVPASGVFYYRGHRFRVLTIHAKAFPVGPLTIKVLIPIPYV